MSKPPVRPAPKPVNKAAPVAKPPIVRPGPIRADDTGFVPPSERKGTSPQVSLPPRPVKPAVSGGNMAKAVVNAATRGGTPVTVKNAPGYRGSGTQPMPSSQPRGFSKGGSASKRADGIATKGKTKGRVL